MNTVLLRIRVAAAAGVIVLAAALRLTAAFEDNSAGARSRAMAGAFVAVADTGETLFLQPAGLSFLRVPALSLTYGKLLTGLSDGSDLNDSVASFGMPLSKLFALGIGYKNAGLATVYREETLVLGGACRPLSFIAAGINVKYLRLIYGQDAYTGGDPLFASGYEKAGLGGDAGIYLNLSPSLNLAWSRQNIIGADTGLKEKVSASAADHLGVSYREHSFVTALESVKSDDAYRFLAGLEKLFLRDTVAVRCGIGWGDRDFRKVTAGLGITFDRFIFDYALEYPLAGLEQTSGTHYVTLSAKFGHTDRTVIAACSVPPAVSSATFLCRSGETAVRICTGTIAASTGTAPCGAVATSSATLKAQITDFLLTISSAAAKAAMSPLPAAATDTIKPSAAASVEPEPAAAVSPDTLQPAPAPSSPSVSTDTLKTVPPKNRPAPKNAAGAVPPPIERSHAMRTHITVPGDTLPVLAERYYGKKTLWMKIFDANKDRIEKGALRPGIPLTIPPAED